MEKWIGSRVEVVFCARSRGNTLYSTFTGVLSEVSANDFKLIHCRVEAQGSSQRVPDQIISRVSSEFERMILIG